MSNPIRIKRGPAATIPVGASGELLWTTDTNELYMGTGSVNIRIQNALTNPVTGTGTTNFLPKFTGASTIGNSQIFDNGTGVGVNTTTLNARFTISESTTTALRIDSGSGVSAISIGGTGSFVVDAPGVVAGRLLLNDDGNMYLGTGGVALQGSERFAVASGNNTAILAKFTGGSESGWAAKLWNNAAGNNNLLLEFTTEASITARGSVRYDRSGNRLNIVGEGNGLLFTGAATFSNDIFARSGTIDSRAFKIFEASAGRGGLYPYNLVVGTGTDYSVGIFSEAEIFLAPGGSATKRFTMSNTGAATFSSSVTQLGEQLLISNSGSPNLQLRKSGVTDWGTIIYDGSKVSIGTFGGGSTTLNVTTAGNVGIGTTSPGSILNISDGSSATRLVVDNTANAAAGAGAFFRVFNGATQVGNATVRVDNTGKFSVFTGTSSDAEQFTIASTGAATFSSSVAASELLVNASEPKITLTPSAYSGSYRTVLGVKSNAEGVLQLGNNGNNFIVAGNTAAGGALNFYVNATSDFIAGTSGTLSLTLAATGAATFSSSVTIQGGNSLFVNNAANTRSGFLRTSGEGTELSSFAGAGEPLILIAPDTTATMRFYTGGSTGANERMRITSGGAVGIGTTSPDATKKLHVIGNGLFATAGSANVVVQRGDTSSGATFDFNTSTTNKWFMGLRGLGNEDFYIFNQTSVANNLILSASTGAATFSSTIQTAAPTGGTAQAWKLGNYNPLTDTATGHVLIEVNGVQYKVLVYT